MTADRDPAPRQICLRTLSQRDRSRDRPLDVGDDTLHRWPSPLTGTTHAQGCRDRGHPQVCRLRSLHESLSLPPIVSKQMPVAAGVSLQGHRWSCVPRWELGPGHDISTAPWASRTGDRCNLRMSPERVGHDGDRLTASRAVASEPPRLPTIPIRWGSPRFLAWGSGGFESVLGLRFSGRHCGTLPEYESCRCSTTHPNRPVRPARSFRRKPAQAG